MVVAAAAGAGVKEVKLVGGLGKGSRENPVVGSKGTSGRWVANLRGIGWVGGKGSVRGEQLEAAVERLQRKNPQIHSEGLWGGS